MPEILGQLMAGGMDKLAGRFSKPACEKVADSADKAIAQQTTARVAGASRDALKLSPESLKKAGAKIGGKEYSQQQIEEFVTPKVTRKPHDPAMPLTPSEAKKAQATMKKNAAREAELLKTLSTKEQASYQNMMSLMKDHPAGQLGLQQNLLEGKLTIGSATNPKRNLMTALTDISTRKLDSSIDRPTLLAQLNQELADPVAVSQEHKGTCAATASGQILWSLRHPADYADFVGGLASPEGKATLPSGQIVHRAPDWRAGNDRVMADSLRPGRSTNNGRSIPSQLTEPAFMQVGIGKAGRYSNSFDAIYGSKTGTAAATLKGDGGLADEQSARLMESIFPGEKYTVAYPTKADLKSSYDYIPKSDWAGERVVMKKQQMLDTIASGASVDNPMRISVNYELDGGHALLATGTHEATAKEIADSAAKAKELKNPLLAIKPGTRMYDYINPWGQQETMPEQAFATTLESIIPNGAVAGVMV